MLQIVAHLNAVDGILSSFTGENFSQYRPYLSSCKCDICGQKRHRNELYVVRDTESGAEKVAGTGCLENLYGKSEVKAAITRARPFDPDSVGSCKAPVYNLVDVVNVAHYLIGKNGFISTKRATETGDISTAENVEDCLLDGAFISNTFYNLENVATQVAEWVEASTSGSDFMFSAKNVFRNWESEVVEGKSLRFAVAVVNSWISAKARKASREEIAQKSEFIGTVGERIKAPTTGTVMELYVNDGAFGIERSYYILTDADNVLMWTTTTNTNIAKGDAITFKAFTVKARFTGAFGNTTKISRPTFA